MLIDKVVTVESYVDINSKEYVRHREQFPLFRKFLYDEKSISYPIIYLWYYLENLYRGEEDRLNIEELENIAKDIYSTNLDQRDLRDSPWIRLAGKYETGEQYEKVLEFIAQNRKELDKKEVESYENCYEIVEEKMYDS